MKLGLYLMTGKGNAVLDAAFASGVEIAHVTTFEARGMADDYHTMVASRAKAAGIPTFTRAHPPKFTGDWNIAAGWRWMLNLPNLVVLHDSLLPRYRGFAPLVTAMVKGDPELGVTAFLAQDADVYDSGPIINQRRFIQTYPATMLEVLSKIMPLYREIAAEVIDDIRNDNLKYVAQDESQATYSVWRDEDDFRIDWTQDDRSIVRLVGAASHPFPGAWSFNTGFGTLGHKLPIRITDAVVEQDVRFEQRHPGKVAFVRDGHPIVVCGTGMVRILKSSSPIPFRTRLT